MYYPLLIVPIAIYSTWQVYKRNMNRLGKVTKRSPIPRDYFVGLNYLLNEQPDKAVDVFIKMLEVDSDTVETHLALGSLFRRRGEVDRAIRIHQNLIARPQLNRDQRIHALLALGQDYMSAGVLDRAERLFQEVVDIGGESTEQSLKSLIDIYQQEKAWEAAISAAQRYESVSGVSMHVNVAHYYCELAAVALSLRQDEQALRYLKKASSVDSDNIRASLMLGDYLVAQEKYKQAIKAYKQVLEQNPNYVSEAIGPLCQCYLRIDKLSEFVEYLYDVLDKTPSITVVIELARRVKDIHGIRAAIVLLQNHCQQRPSVRGINEMIKFQNEVTSGEERERLDILHALCERILQERPIYRCDNCGFSGKQLHWVCPGCRLWNTSKPIHGIEGD